MVTADSAGQGLVRLLGGAVDPGESPDVSVGKSPYQTELEHFIRCAVTGEESVVDARDAYEALRICPPRPSRRRRGARDAGWSR